MKLNVIPLVVLVTCDLQLLAFSRLSLESCMAETSRNQDIHSFVPAVPGYWSYRGLTDSQTRWYFLRTSLSLKGNTCAMTVCSEVCEPPFLPVIRKKFQPVDVPVLTLFVKSFQSTSWLSSVYAMLAS